MTDNEIIKALECCIGGYGVRNCDNCPNMGYGCIEVIPEFALDLINRQRAEIEKLQHHCFGIQNELEAYKDTFNTAIDEVKSEAIKEFAERLKALKIESDCIQFGHFVTPRTIDNLVKEMTEVK